MSYIGNIPTTAAFLVDTFSGDGSDTTFTLSQAPANTSSILVSVSGVLQDPSTYSVSGTTLTFSAAPPSGSSNISVRFLGIPASGVTTTAYRTVTTFTATAGQTTFSVPSYTVGYIDVYRNGVKLGTADYTATSGTSVILANACTAGDLVETVSFFVSSVLNAIPAVAGAVTNSYLLDGSVTTAKIAAGAVVQADLATGVAGTGPAFRAYQGSNQTIANGTWTKMQINTENFDTNSNYDTSNYRFTPTVAGYYSISVSLRTVTNSTFSYVFAAIYKNGNSWQESGVPVYLASYAVGGCSGLVYLNGTTDYIEPYLLLLSGGTNTLETNSVQTLFSAALVRAA